MYFKVCILPTKTLTKIKIFIQKLLRNIEYFAILKVYLENANIIHFLVFQNINAGNVRETSFAKLKCIVSLVTLNNH